LASTVVQPPLADVVAARASQPARGIDTTPAACFHCGQSCGQNPIVAHDRCFCCPGCLAVHEILAQSGLEGFYDLAPSAGVRVTEPATPARWAFLDEPDTAPKILDFTDGKIARVTFHIPAIHCVACVWLLENLFRLDPGVGRATVNFPQREVAIMFSPQKIALSKLVALLASIGYEPRLTLGELEKKVAANHRKKQWLQIGLAGFAFGNIMLVSLPLYMGLDSASGPLMRKLFGYISLLLALPVVTYSASDYWKSALASLRQRTLTLDVPIALGLAALYLQSMWEILAATGDGYLDSLTGLVFFLLCGRAFQQMIHHRIAFDRDYKSFFPLSTTRVLGDGQEQSVSLADLKVGDRLRLRSTELIPADAVLLSGAGLVDYSFVSGECEPARCEAGDRLYAGGKQIGGVIEIEIAKPVSQSYLVSLWNHEAFRKNCTSELNSLTNRYSRWFTVVVVFLAVGSAATWVLLGDPGRGLKAFTSVLIVACPCALALAAPFTLGTAQRILGGLNIYLRHALVLETMAQVDTVVLDKTGTLTSPAAGGAQFIPAAGMPALSPSECAIVRSLASQSLHPHSLRIAAALSVEAVAGHGPDKPLYDLHAFVEKPGAGIAGTVQGRDVRLGSANWLRESGILLPEPAESPTGTFLAIDGQCRGWFLLSSDLRNDVEQGLCRLAQNHRVVLLSGDNDRERARFQTLLGEKAELHFNQSPFEKLQFIRNIQDTGSGSRRVVLMIGDGLNDAGALKQSDVGVAVIENTAAFSPSSDVILDAAQVGSLQRIIALAQQSVRIVRWNFGLSAAYNVVGVTIAAAGILSPVICAILMPVSSASVVFMACALTTRAARKVGISAPS
jgi:P-type Cu+ transporter